MSDVDITSGGLISVSAPLLREQADALMRASSLLADAHDALVRATGALAANPYAGGEVGTALSASQAATRSSIRSQELGDGLRYVADTYECVEWEAARLAHAAANPQLADVYAQRQLEVAANNEAAFVHMWWLRDGDRSEDPLSQIGRELLADGAVFGHLADGLAPPVESYWWQEIGAATLGSLGRMPPGYVANIRSDGNVKARLVRETNPNAEAQDIGSMLTHLPSGADVSITTYEYAGGEREHVLAIGGTENWWPIDSPHVLDLTSNLELYLAGDSSLREAVGHAMAAAGVLETERITEIGYSQGAMGVLAEASDQRFNITQVITVGSPQDAWLPEYVQHVDLSHYNDPVAMLAIGGWGVSGLAQRDITIRAPGGHGPRDYRNTADKADGSGDPRVEELHEQWQRFGDAESVTRRDYELERTK